MVIEGRGTQAILNELFNKDPFEVYVNNQLNNSCIRTCELGNDINNITLRFNDKIISGENMFLKLGNIIEINLTNFDTSNINNMLGMFSHCTKLKKITFGNIDTSLVTNMKHLFFHCEHLTSIDLSNFQTSLVTTMEEMFSNCKKLQSIDVSSFNTSKVENMYDLFAHCYELELINLSNFDTSKVTRMQGMFYLSRNIKYLDLGNFKASSLINMMYMFNGCTQLLYLNLRLFKIENKNIDIRSVFSSNIVKAKICIEDIDTQEFFLEIANININCSDTCFQNNIKFDLEQNECKEINNDNEYSTLYYESFSESNYIFPDNFNITNITNSTKNNPITTEIIDSESNIVESYNITQEEYLEIIRQYLYNNFHLILMVCILSSSNQRLF